MIIQNRTEEFKEELIGIYDIKISKVLATAENIAFEGSKDFIARVQEKIDQSVSSELLEFQELSRQRVASLRLECDQSIAEAKSELIAAMNQYLLDEIQNLSVKEKSMIVKKMHSAVIKKIKEQGFSLSDFTLSIWKGVKIASCKSVLADLVVRAESKDVVIEDSINEFLSFHKDQIIRIVSHYIEENLV